MQAWGCRRCRLINYTLDEVPPERCVMHPGGDFEQLTHAEVVARKHAGYLGVYIGEARGHRNRTQDGRRRAAAGPPRGTGSP